MLKKEEEFNASKLNLIHSLAFHRFGYYNIVQYHEEYEYRHFLRN